MTETARPMQGKTVARAVSSHDYSLDVGNLHVIDWYLERAQITLYDPHFVVSPHFGRYLDGEEEREGTYR